MENKKIINSEEIKHYIQQEKIQYIKVGITDVDGVLRGKYMHSEKFMKALEEGFGFCDVIFGWDLHDELYIFRESKDCSPFTGWHTGFPDTKIRIIFNSMREIPFEERTPLFLSELESPALCPRGVLKKVLERLKEKGFLARAALEYEFFLFNETSRTIEEKEFKNLENYTPGMFGYSILRNSVKSDFFQDILSMCSSMDMSLEGLHTETGPGVIEAAISVDEALLAADKATIFKTFMKVLAQKNNLIATFMAKWSKDFPGQSGHIHCSLVDQNGNPSFDDSEERGQELLNYFLGGLQRYMREFCVLLAPTVNSYKRLSPGAWAPINMTWGTENRTVGFRFIKGNPYSQRIENRIAGADANPYLAIAATVGAGLLGIENKIELTPETKGNAYSKKVSKDYRVPTSLKEATMLFKRSAHARSLFGDNFVDHFSSTREWEYDQYTKYGTPFRKDPKEISKWELSRYFEII